MRRVEKILCVLLRHKSLRVAYGIKLLFFFDGQGGFGLGEDISNTVRCTFSRNETADDKIKRFVSQAKNKKCIVVVTNDREIQYFVKALGAKVLSVEKFWSKTEYSENGLNKVPKKKDKAEPACQKRISRTTASKINSELENVWLKDGKKNKS